MIDHLWGGIIGAIGGLLACSGMVLGMSTCPAPQAAPPACQVWSAP